jgi:hypothetical protein
MDRPVDGVEAGQISAAIARGMAARHARDGRVRFWRLVVVSAFFAVVLSANLFVGAVVVFGNMRVQANAEKAATNGQIARVTRPLLDGTFCRYTVFDNNTANTIEDRVERCDSPRGKPKIRAKSEFTWGGK